MEMSGVLPSTLYEAIKFRCHALLLLVSGAYLPQSLSLTDTPLLPLELAPSDHCSYGYPRLPYVTL